MLKKLDEESSLPQSFRFTRAFNALEEREILKYFKEELGFDPVLYFGCQQYTAEKMKEARGKEFGFYLSGINDFGSQNLSNNFTD